MPVTLPKRSATTEAHALVSSCQSVALSALRTEVERSGVSQKALAQEVTDGDEPLFSKRLAGTPGRPFPLADLDHLPRAIVVAWMKRYGSAIGLRVTDLEPGEVSERLLTLVDELASVAKLARIVTKPLKAGPR